MKKVRCQFCHEYVDQAKYDAHRARHVRQKADGQQTDYVTLPPSERDRRPLDGVPRVYVHRVCGACTGMPEDIIRSYLKNPFLYSADRTFCTGCGEHVPLSECEWTETGEDLQSYTDRLRSRAYTRPGLFHLTYWAIVIPALGLGSCLTAYRKFQANGEIGRSDVAIAAGTFCVGMVIAVSVALSRGRGEDGSG
jgi:hypothetical protein